MFIDLIDADFETLTNQASIVVSKYLSAAVSHIDDLFGEGHAEETPVLTGAFVLAATIDCAVATLAQQIRRGLAEVASEISSISFPDISDELSALADANQSIASAIENR